jgi:hypothetical protein
MKQKLSRNPIVFFTVLSSFAWNVLLLVAVVLDLDFAHTRASGGQFTNFPLGIRIVYFLQLALVIYQVWIFKLIFHTERLKVKWTPKLFFILGIMGIILNAASRSANERWNVIPAVIITWAFWYYGVKKVNTGL